MPLIQISDEETSDRMALIVAGIMLYPDNRETAFVHFVRHSLLSEQYLHDAPNAELVSLPASWIKALVAGPSLDELRKGNVVRMRKGSTAGALLIAMYLVSQLGKPVTFSRAINVVERSKMNDRDGRAEFNIYGTRAEIFNAWALMRPVAHLYASLMVLQGFLRSGLQLPAQADALVELLRLAGGFLDWAGTQAVTVNRRSGPVLSREDVWALPDRFTPLPLGAVTRETLPPWMQHAIDRYTSSQ